MEWIPQFETGLETIDLEHAGLVALVDRLASYFADERRVTRSFGPVLDTLGEYASEQFYVEESLMTEMGVEPGHLEHHRAAHQRFMHDFGSLRHALCNEDLQRFARQVA